MKSMNALAALADPTRRKIIELLAERDRTAGDLVARFDISAPAISQHLKILREAGLVTSEVDGQRRIQALDPKGLHEIFSWVERTRRTWEKRLDILERILREEDSQPTKATNKPKPKTK
jgi:DNA-binding transcriptional ArsR family regulator